MSRLGDGIFHLAICVDDLNAAKHFYGQVLGLKQGRETESWVDFDFFGHQLSLHLGTPFAHENCGKVGAHKVPMPHFGAALLQDDWQKLAKRLENHVEWIIAPTTRFAGTSGEQKIMFFKDPSGNPIEIKGFKDWQGVYATKWEKNYAATQARFCNNRVARRHQLCHGARSNTDRGLIDRFTLRNNRCRGVWRKF